MNPLEITYVTHACIKIQGEFGTLLTDPWILNEPIYGFTTWKFPPAIIPPDALVKDLNYLYISHPHEDHLHVPSLHYFSREIKILLPEYTDYPCLRAQTVELTLRHLGFYNIKKIRPWQTINLSANETFTIIPASKDKYWDWENSGFVLATPHCKILNMNDCPSSKEIYEKLDQCFGEIDLGFVQYSGVSMFPGRYRMPIESMREASAKRKHSWVQQKNMIDFLKIKRIAPFAGDFAWLDDELIHCNWANRATPKLFENFVKENYSEKNIKVVIMYPTDTWTLEEGLQRNHPEIDWSNYLTSINNLSLKLSKKVQAIKQWLESSNKIDLEVRSRAYTSHLNAWMTKEFIDFNARIRFIIEGPHAGFSFVMQGLENECVKFIWDDTDDVDQLLYIPESTWSAVLEGKMLLTNLQWASQNFQCKDFRVEIARMWFWFENHADLNNRNPQVLIDPALHPHIAQRIRPMLGVFTVEDEWKKLKDTIEVIT